MRNKKIADRLLIILMFVFIIIILLKVYFHKSFFMDMVSFVVEAALIGGIADWFAITALYKKPLGFPWHTAIIPRNRDKVIESVAYMVENELLSKKTLESKMEQLKFVDLAIKYIDTNSKTGEYIFPLIEKYVPKLLDSIDINRISNFIENGLKNNLKEVNLSSYLGRILIFMIKSDDCEKMLNSILDELTIRVNKESTKNEIYNILNEVVRKNIDNKKGIGKFLIEAALGLAEQTDSVNIHDIADSVQQELLKILLRLKDKNDPLHIQIIDKAEGIIKQLHADEKMIRQVEMWKLDTIEKITISNELNNIIGNIIITLKQSIKKDNLQTEKDEVYSNSTLPVINWIKKQVHNYWQDFKADDKTKNVVEDYIKDFIYKVIRSEHHVIGVVVSKTLNNLTDESLNDFIQKKAGNDLHWIRINGCMVGAIFGLVVFLFMNEIYLPILSKLIHLL